jgi:predicted Zn-dependent protease with MMP-like domain
MRMSRADFEVAISEALDNMPAAFAELMENVVIQVRETPDRQTMEDLGIDPRRATLFGLYTGVPLDKRGGWYGNVLPDVILLYRQPLLSACRTRRDLIRQIQLTLLHEIGHHFGLDDNEMQAWEAEFSGLDDPGPYGPS